MRIVIADEHPSFRDALTVFLETDPSLTLVGEADSADGLLDAVVRLQPDVVIMEASSPGLPGIDLIPLVRHASPHTRVIVLSTNPTTSEASAAAQAGAMGYLSKDLVVRDLFDALWNAYHSAHSHDGHSRPGDPSPVWPGARSDTDDDGPDHAPGGFILSMPSVRLEAEDESGIGRLSRYERHCLALLASGYSLAQMADTLNLPLPAVEMYQRRMMVKLGVETVEQLRAIAAGWVAPDER